MPDTAPFLIVGNWKMNGLRGDLVEAERLAGALEGRSLAARVVLCPPATLLGEMAEALKGSPIAVGAQDCHAAPEGAHTGDISAPMLADAGATYVVVGHSDRRRGYGEPDAVVAAKARAAIDAGLVPIVCLGSTSIEPLICAETAGSIPSSRDGDTFVVAYEPLWDAEAEAPSSSAAIARAHEAIRAVLAARLGESDGRTPILYAGPVDAGDAAAILGAKNIDGLLVGEASLQARTFLPIIEAADRAARQTAGAPSLGNSGGA